jgi:hypothetical protein
LSLEKKNCSDAMKIVDDLIESEHSLLDATHVTGVQFTGFATSWQAAARYHTFLTLIVEREAEAIEIFSLASRALRDTPPSPGPIFNRRTRAPPE